MGIFSDVFKRNLNLRDALDLEFQSDPSARSYLKRIALETNINFISRTFSQSKFWVIEDDSIQSNTLSYKLNVRPNTDSSASDFWHKVIYKLVFDNEVLIIKTDTDDLVIADDFYREEYALYDDVFKGVVVKDYEYERIFRMNEVIYITYNNEKLSRYVDSLFNDYGELFGRMMDNQLRKNQIRATVSVAGGAGGLNDQKIQRLQKFVNKVYDSFKTESVAIVPEIDGFEFKEVSQNNMSGSDNGAENIQKIKRLFIDDVSKMIGIPPELINGDMSGLKDLQQAYLDFCINPLIKKIEDELNAKFFTQSEHEKGSRIEVVGLNKADPLKNADKIDKLISSGAFNRNEVRRMHGRGPIEGGDEFMITKNYEKENTALKGGENSNEEGTTD